MDKKDKKIHWYDVVAALPLIFVLLVILAIITGTVLLVRKNWTKTVTSYEVSRQANNFNVPRKLTVVNARTDTVLLEFTGTFSISNSGADELEVLCAIGDGKYQKHYIYLNEWTIYVVEDVSNNDVELYDSEFVFLPNKEAE